MGKLYSGIDENLQRFIESQHLFFVATAPSGGHGRVNESLPRAPGVAVRAIVRIDVTRIHDACGYGVPLLKYEGDREHAAAWAKRKGPEGIEEYKRQKNAVSIDGIPGLQGMSEAAPPDPEDEFTATTGGQLQGAFRTLGSRSSSFAEKAMPGRNGPTVPRSLPPRSFAARRLLLREVLDATA